MELAIYCVGNCDGSTNYVYYYYENWSGFDTIIREMSCVIRTDSKTN